MTDTWVVDASAAMFALVDPSSSAADLAGRLAGVDCHAPYLFDAEVGSVMRRSLRSGAVDEDTAKSVLYSSRFVIDERYPHTGPLADAAWELRDSLPFYDALYVALATSLDVPLITADARLARSPGLPCEVEVVG